MKAPERVWLQRHDNPNDAFAWTWADHQIHDDDVEYILAPVSGDTDGREPEDDSD